MNPRAIACLAISSIAPLLRAASSDAAIVAAMHLTDQSGYTWATTVADDARTYELAGRTMKGGYTWVKMPVINSVRRRLGRSVTDEQIDVIFKGNVRCVFETDEGWKTVDELPRADVRGPDAPVPVTVVTGIVNKPPPLRRDEMEVGPYSNLQLAICHPHEELGVIVTSHADLRLEDGIATGTLNEIGAQLLLVHDGQADINPLRATGAFKLWIRGGIVTRYQITLDGTLAVTTPLGRREINVHQTMDTTLRAIGTTKFEVPDEAKRKLGR